MKGYNGWSYHPYRPLMIDVGDIYICRVAPSKDSIHFEWLKEEEAEFNIYYRKRDTGDFVLAGKTTGTEYDITNLYVDTDYEFYVEANGKKSLVRLARCAEAVGTVVNYLHPEDEAYKHSGWSLCSPSLVRHPEGFLFASMDVFKGTRPQNLTLIFRSDDEGKTWHYVSELMPCFWGKMFIHKGELYMIGCSTEYGDLLIGKSTDGGKTFTEPTVILRGGNGKDGIAGVHKNPQPMVCHNGRIHGTIEWGSYSKPLSPYCHVAMVISCDENDDLLVAENWSITEPKKFEQSDHPALSEYPDFTMTIEGTLVVAPDKKLYNIMRTSVDGYAMVYEVDAENHEAKLKFSRLMDFWAHRSKFTIKYDEVSGRYITIADYIFDKEKKIARTYLVLMSSKDLVNWQIDHELFDLRHLDPAMNGMQYIDYEIEGDDIIYLSRTALNCARNYHDANYSTFHTLKNFRDYLK